LFFYVFIFCRKQSGIVIDGGEAITSVTAVYRGEELTELTQFLSVAGSKSSGDYFSILFKNNNLVKVVSLVLASCAENER
jgi:actin-related protein